MLSPNKLSLMRDVDYIPVNQFSGLVPTLRVGSGTIGTNMEIGLDVNTASAKVEGGTGITAERILTTTPEDAIRQISLGTGFPYLTKIQTSTRSGLLMTTANDAVSHTMRIPPYWDVRNDIFIRVLWTTLSNTVADTVDWRFRYLLNQANLAAAGGLFGAPTTVLDTVIPQDNSLGLSGGAALTHLTADGVLKGGTITEVQDFLHFTVDMNAFAAGLTESKWLLGVEFEYTRRMGRGLKLEGRASQRGQ